MTRRCRYCDRDLDEEEVERCAHVEKCSARVARRLSLVTRTMATKPFVGFDPDKAYREQMGR